MRKNCVPTQVQESIFKELLSHPENTSCADCNQKAPAWISLTFGVFLCLRCSGHHRGMGAHIARVRSVKLDSLTKEELEVMTRIGNKVANEYYEYKIIPGYKKPNYDCSSDSIRRYIYDKYINKKFINKDEIEPIKKLQQEKTQEKIVEIPKALPEKELEEDSQPEKPVVQIDLLSNDDFVPQKNDQLDFEEFVTAQKEEVTTTQPQVPTQEEIKEVSSNSPASTSSIMNLYKQIEQNQANYARMANQLMFNQSYYINLPNNYGSNMMPYGSCQQQAPNNFFIPQNYAYGNLFK